MSREDHSDLAVSKAVKLSLSPAPHSPRIKLAPALLRTLRIGAGRPAILKLSLPDEAGAASSSSSSLETGKRREVWVAGAVWPYRPENQDKRAASGSRSASSSHPTKPQEGVFPRCLYPGISTSGDEVVDVEIFHTVAASKREVEELQWEVETSDGADVGQMKLSASSREILAMVVKELLIELTCVLPSQRIVVPFQSSSIVLKLAGRETELADTPENAVASLLHVGRSTHIAIVSSPSVQREDGPVSLASAGGDAASSSAPRKRLGGLQEEVRQLKELVFLPLMRPELFQQHGLQPPRGVLLHGPPGTGKTSLALSISSSFLSPSQIFTISGPELSSSYHGRTEARIRKVFRDARKNDMSVIIIDEIDVIAGSREGGESDGVGSRVVATLLTEIDGVGQSLQGSSRGKGKRRSGRDDDESNESGDESEEEAKGGPHAGRVVVIAATNRPNAIDPALRRPGRLDREIEIGVPSPAARLDILTTLLSDTPHSLTADDIHQVASRTHGFVGADLSALIREAGMKVIRRRLADEQVEAGGIDHLSVQVQQKLKISRNARHLLTAEDLFSSVPLMRPSSLRSMLPPPPLSWSSIGLGSPDSPYSIAKQRILQSVEWPLKYSSQMKKLGISGGRGVLLYGPPGCSKTMIARACAQSEGINFIGVKGPELFSKYLGDSEKALRDLFRKARAASPAIVFFDEIDALTATRSSGGGEDQGSSAVNDRVIATLLTEMDGADVLDKVVIIAATNRPEVIDPALLRPGRLDTLLYIGPPDRSARLSILALRCKSMATRSDEVDLGKIADLVSNADTLSVRPSLKLALMYMPCLCVLLPDLTDRWLLGSRSRLRLPRRWDSGHVRESRGRSGGAATL
ncbi:AAA-domain-containing protein [Microstroma glucosiphilum]|uniref:AAA-domain-containing protein n=1 Tax=Pseudomicrostroma glucosiphilum TaxID=1684307 RepID=A0A316UHJ2_9BASI|nr:AAA-domain-containing protein [Pseudomicrostroma glucosiphilum]PWN23403.1 AAA-domain-containing protein [Pseudomicrostroma glucosiphilum]